MNNQLKPIGSTNGEIISPANFTAQNLSFGVRRQVNRDAQLAIARTIKTQMAVQGKARVTQTAMTELASLQNTVLTVTNMYPDSGPYLNHLLGEFVFSAANEIRDL